MLTAKNWCQDRGISPDVVFDLVLGQGSDILPGRGFTGYLTEIRADGLFCYNDKLNIEKEILFSSFTEAEFGIGSGQLWLQCIVDGQPFVFCSTRKNWKAPSAKLLLKRISEHTEIKSQEEYDRYTGKLFLFYALIR